MNTELTAFCASLVCGMVCALIFDMFRAVRKVFGGGVKAVAAQDILLWVILAAVSFFAVYRYNDGQLRLFVFVAILSGAVLYILTLSGLFMRMWVGFFKVLALCAAFLVKTISAPFEIVGKKIVKINRKARRFLCKTKNNIKNQKKQLKMY